MCCAWNKCRTFSSLCLFIVSWIRKIILFWLICVIQNFEFKTHIQIYLFNGSFNRNILKTANKGITSCN